MNSELVVSFDFDNTLTEEKGKSMAKDLINRGYRIIIITSRPHDVLYKYQNNSDLYELSRELGIPERDIIFTTNQPKEMFMVNSKIKIHVDDCEKTIDEINKMKNGPIGVRMGPMFDINMHEALSKFTFIENMIQGGKLLDEYSKLSKDDVSLGALNLRNKFQKSGQFHPLTCMSFDGCERDKQSNYGTLIATKDGWVCPCGKYKQNF